MPPPTQDPRRLKRRRIEAGLNRRELAAKAGIHRSYMTWLEAGGRSASPRVLKRLAKALACEPADLMAPEPSADQPETDDPAGAE
jgi:transcriptional regulator with XRE-family HTH domain